MADATDDFNRANGGLGANWTTASGANAPAISSNAVIAPVNGAENSAIWTADAFEDDQYSQFVLRTGNVFQAALVRWQSGAYSGYLADSNVWGASGRAAIFRVDAGGFTQLALGSDGSAQWADGDTLKLEVIGTTIKVYRNGVEVLSATDANYTTGSPGLRLFNGFVSGVDDWLGGPIAGGGGFQSVWADGATEVIQ